MADRSPFSPRSLHHVQEARRWLQNLHDLQSREDKRLEFACLVETLDELVAVAEAASALYEQVQMAESVGVCLPDRVPTLTLGDALGQLWSDDE